MDNETYQLPNTEEQAVEQLNQKLEERRQACLRDLTKAIREVCTAHNCQFDVKMTIHGNGNVVPMVDVIPLPLQQEGNIQ